MTVTRPNNSFTDTLQDLIEYPTSGILSKVLLKDNNSILIVGQCLLQAIKDVLADSATAEVMTAWTKAYQILMVVINGVLVVKVPK